MKKFFLKLIAIWLLIIASNGYAKWQILDHTKDGDDIYFETSSLKRNNQFVNIMFLASFKSAKQTLDSDIYSTKWYTEYDCHEKTSRILSRSIYAEKMGQGKSLSTNDNAEQPVLIAPGTKDDYILMTVCNK